MSMLGRRTAATTCLIDTDAKTAGVRALRRSSSRFDPVIIHVVPSRKRCSVPHHSACGAKRF